MTVPVVYVTVAGVRGEPGVDHLQRRTDGIKVHSPVAETTVTVDDDGFILDYPGLAERI